MYMGTAVLVAWARLSGEVEHLEYAGRQLVAMAGHLTGEDGWLHHGYSHYTGATRVVIVPYTAPHSTLHPGAGGRVSCCVWGRGHGWAVLATTELLAAAAELGLDTEVVAAVTSLYRRHARLLLGAQSEDTGLWHNILTDTETFTETSASAMFLTGKFALLYHVCST